MGYFEMTWIEGIGDEVTLFFMITLVIIVGAIAWVSTSTADQPIIRTVLILERRAVSLPREIMESVEATQSAMIEGSIDTGQPASANNTNVEGFVGASYLPCDRPTNPLEETDAPVWSSEDDGDQNEGEREQSASRESDDRSHPSLTNSDSYVAPEDVEHCSLRNLRLTYLNSRRPSHSEDPAAEPTQPESQINDSYNLVGNIRIRLKYLNDDQKMVHGHLEEQLGEFKRRHFSPELSDDKLVRLIFNGHVLQSDSETLQSCGLFDNCVVHCLVHPQRSNTGNQSESSAGRDGNPTANAASVMEGVFNRDWDMGNLLLISLSLLLGVAWYCRFLYGQLFNATTTVALAGLTGILVISFVGTYLPDQDFTRH